jgi:hypothetical protein
MIVITKINEQPRGRAIGVSTTGIRYAKVGFYLLLPTPKSLQRGFSQRDAFGIGNFCIPSFMNFSDPKDQRIKPLNY